MIKINLLPHKKVKAIEKGLQRLRGLIGIVTVLVVLVLGYWSWHLINARLDLSDTETQRNAQLNQMKEKLKEVENYEKIRAEAGQKLATIQEIERKKILMTPMLNVINQASGKDTWLTSLQVSGPSVGVEAMTRDTRKNVDAFADRLKASPVFADVSVSDVKEEPTAEGAHSRYSFKLTARLTGLSGEEGRTAPTAPPAPAGRVK